MVSARYGEKIIDGSLSDWTSAELIATGRNNGIAGRNLDQIYVA